jgi:RNA recognition motif-containing protein
MNAKLYVGNLLYETTEDDLKDLFAQAGSVVSTTIIRFRDSGRSIETFHGQDFKGRKMVVSEARPPRERGSYDAPKQDQPMGE